MSLGNFGKYKGKVTDNKDPRCGGRVKVNVPSVMGNVSNWAEPCFPYVAGSAGVLFVPPEKADVWVEFIAGNSEYPIWVGGFFILKSSDQTPAPPIGPQVTGGTEEMVIQVGKNNSLTIIDATGDQGGGMVLKSNNASITINDQGITLKDASGGTIEIKNGTVSINGRNLVIQK